ncbi:AIM37 (YNL100W) [Zygosaccharomyces parabailii]|nr:AIM37 (YNL100W) [Zygosaccharomyces parabailii]
MSAVVYLLICESGTNQANSLLLIKVSQKLVVIKMLFYSNTDEPTESDKSAESLKAAEGINLKTELLPTGNQVTQSPQLTEKLHEWRKDLIRQYSGLLSEWSNLKSAANNEIATGQEYFDNNVFQDPYENERLIVPSAILSLGAFFCGRVLTNKFNWGYTSILHTSPSILGRIFTSLPSRVVLPVALAIGVFGQVTPSTARSSWNTLERDFLPECFVSSFHRLWNQWYVEGLKNGSRELGESIQNNLQNGIRNIRESVIEMNN